MVFGLTGLHYYPFGMVQPGRKFTAGNGYRYGFNGKENDNDISDGVQDYGMRIYNEKIGKFLSVDPISKKFPSLSPFQFASNCAIAGGDLDGLEFLPRYNPSDPYSLTAWSITKGIVALENSRAGKVINGLWNTAAGAVGMTASVTYIAGSDGIGAGLGGIAAFDLSAGQTSIGIAQLTEAFASNKPENDFLHKASNIPGLIAYGLKSDKAGIVDALGGMAPVFFTSGEGKSLFSLQGLVKNGFGVIESVKDFALNPSILSTIGMIDALKNVKDLAVESFQLFSETYQPTGGAAAMDANLRLKQTLVYKLSYTIAKGDNLTSIAKKLNTTIEKLAKENNISNVDNITAGKKLTSTNQVSSTRILWRKESKK